MAPRSGKFIVFEGLDGAGTTTQSARLQDYFTQQGASSFATFEPTDSPIGSFIRSILTGDAPYVPERAMALLFAADRLDHTARILHRRDTGSHVVCDRYVYSSMAYQSLDAGITGEWVVEINSGCAVPDVTFFLDVPVDVCLDRLNARGDDRTVYEKREILAGIEENYRRLARLYKQQYGPVVTIDGTMSPDEVFAAVVARLDSLK